MSVQNSIGLAISPSTALWLLVMLNAGAATATSSDFPLQDKTPQVTLSTQPEALHKTTVLAELASATAATGNVEQALQLFDAALQIAQTIENSPKFKIQTLCAIAVKLAESGQRQRALQVFTQAVKLTEKKVEYFDQDEALRDIVIQVAQVGEQEQALQLTQKIASGYRQAEALNRIAVTLAEAGKLEQAKQTLFKALDSARGITGDYVYESNGSCGNYKFEVMSEIAGNLALVEQLKTALEVAQEIYGCSSASQDYRADYQAWAFLGIIRHLTNVGEIMQTLEAAKPVSDDIEKSIILPGVAVELAKIGEVNLALQVTKTLDDLHFEPETLYKDFALRDIATGLLAVGQVEAALQVANSISDEGIKKFVLALAKVGQLEESLRVAQTIKDSYLKADAFKGIVAYLAQRGQFEQAFLVVQSMESSSSKAELLATIVPKLTKIVQVEQALQITQTLEAWKYTPLAKIALKLVELGQTEGTLNLGQTSEGQHTPEVSTDIANKLANQNIEQALSLARSIEDKALKAETMAGIAAQLIKSEVRK